MENNITKEETNNFREESSFEDKVIYALLGTGLVGATLGFLTSFYGEYPATKTAAYFVVVLGLGLSLWILLQLKFKVSISETRIKYKMFPLHYKPQRITWDEIESCEIVKTPYYAQWHGANISYNQSWFSLTGRNGLSIRTKDGRSLFIGCKDMDGLTKYFAEHFSYTENGALVNAEIPVQAV